MVVRTSRMPPDSRCVISMVCAKGNCAIHSGCFQNSRRLVTSAACVVGVQRRHLPGGSEEQQAVNRQAIAIAPDFDGVRVQQIALPVGPICIAIQTIGPRRKKRDAGLRWLLLPLAQAAAGS